MCSENHANRLAALIRDRLAQIETENRLGRDGQAVVQLDQQSVGRLSRMDALQNQAMALAHRYIDRHAEQIADRGCEGTLINYHVTIPYFIDHIRAVFVKGETECSHLLPRFDEPPAPMI